MLHPGWKCGVQSGRRERVVRTGRGRQDRPHPARRHLLLPPDRATRLAQRAGPGTVPSALLLEIMTKATENIFLKIKIKIKINNVMKPKCFLIGKSLHLNFTPQKTGFQVLRCGVGGIKRKANSNQIGCGTKHETQMSESLPYLMVER